jgi:hypothetical protein
MPRSLWSIAALMEQVDSAGSGLASDVVAAEERPRGAPSLSSILLWGERTSRLIRARRWSPRESTQQAAARSAGAGPLRVPASAVCWRRRA